MKTFAACFCATLGSFAAFAQINPQQIEDQKAALQRAADNYGKVYGAWLVDKQCSFLADNENRQLQNDLHTIQQAIPQDPAIQNMHLMVEDSAREVAGTPPFSDCGQESRKLVTQAKTLAQAWASVIRSGQPRS